MRILVCPAEFKGTLPARRVARAMAEGVRRGRPAARVDVLPLSDGGPGLLDALTVAVGGQDGAGDEPHGAGRVVEVAVEDPLGRPAQARMLLLPPAANDEVSAVAESADACGLQHLSEEERRPLVTGTEGVGDLVDAAASRGAHRLYLGLGGSATCDGGAGAARRLGWRFLDSDGRALERGGGSLERLARVEEAEESRGDGSGGSVAAPAGLEVVVLADVRNPLLGPRGAARTFAPQKGASPAEVRTLEVGLSRLAALSPRPELRDRPGAGAAGGLGFGCAAFLGASIVPGAPWLLERVSFDDRLSRADWLITGEGAYDRTTGMGKVVEVVLRRARDRKVPAALLCGRLDDDPPEGVDARDGGGRELDARKVADLAEELAAAT